MGGKDAPLSDKPDLKTCGLVMPISAADGCSAEHWIEVKSIITEAIEGIQVPRLTVRLVSDADDVGVIQKRIVQNVYTADIVVCDVSAKNPNVMFELGMRLAFDKPTVIIKDDKTDYAFDTGVIEHIGYPRDLRFTKMVAFKKQLQDKVTGTLKAADDDPNHSTFLKNFGTFHVAKLEQTVASPDQVVLEMLQELQSDMNSLRRNVQRTTRAAPMKQKIRDAIATYCDAHGVKEAATLLNDPDCQRFIEEAIDAPRHFSGRSEFIAYLEKALKAHDEIPF